MTSFFDLSEDLVVEILSRLPPESLLQIKYVNKQFHKLFTTLIKDPTFVVKHLHNSNNKKSSTSFIFKSLIQHKFEEGLLTIYHEEGDKEINYDIDSNFLRLAEISDLIIYIIEVGSHCNGISFIADESLNRFLLCNPAIGEFVELPYSNFNQTFMIGLGYDSFANVYKVVKMGKDSCLDDEATEVYTFGTSSWKKINNEIEITGIKNGNGVYCEGMCFWLVWNGNDNDFVVSFDFHTEEFQRILLPINLRDAEREINFSRWDSLAVWNKSLALITCDKEEIEMWSRSSCGWSKILTLDLPGEILQFPVAFWKGDEELLMAMKNDDNKHLVSYNLRSKTVRSLGFKDIVCFYVSNYVQSLISITHKNYIPH